MRHPDIIADIAELLEERLLEADGRGNNDILAGLGLFEKGEKQDEEAGQKLEPETTPSPYWTKVQYTQLLPFAIVLTGETLRRIINVLDKCIEINRLVQIQAAHCHFGS
jgi:hypothetical protein